MPGDWLPIGGRRVYLVEAGGEDPKAPAVILLHGRELIASKKVESFHQGITTKDGELFEEAARCFIFCNGDGGRHQHGAGIHALVHLHDGDTRLFIPGENSPLNGGSPPVPGQE